MVAATEHALLRREGSRTDRCGKGWLERRECETGEDRRSNNHNGSGEFNGTGDSDGDRTPDPGPDCHIGDLGTANAGGH